MIRSGIGTIPTDTFVTKYATAKITQLSIVPASEMSNIGRLPYRSLSEPRIGAAKN